MGKFISVSKAFKERTSRIHTIFSRYNNKIRCMEQEPKDRLKDYFNSVFDELEENLLAVLNSENPSEFALTYGFKAENDLKEELNHNVVVGLRSEVHERLRTEKTYDFLYDVAKKLGMEDALISPIELERQL